jgi:hypothetical protein
VSSIAFKPIFRINVETTPQIIGDVPMGFFRRAGIITAGSFSGERLSGKVLPGGGDWLFRRPDGVTHLDVRAMLETSEGETIYMTYTGLLNMSDAVQARLAAGETIAAHEMYFRTAVQFETAAPDLLWLNNIVAFGIGERRPTGPSYEIFELL